MAENDFEIRMVFKSRADARSRVRSVLESVLATDPGGRFRQEEIDEILLAIQESLSNVARHAYAGVERPVELRVELGQGLFRAWIRDDGAPIAPERIVVRDPAEPRASGRGMFVLASTMDKVEFRREGRRNVLRLERARRRGRP